MEIEVELTNDDYVAFQMFHVKHSPTLRRQRMRSIRIILLILLVWCGLLAVLILLSETPWETLRAIRPLLLGPVLFVLFMVLLARRRGARMIASVLDEGVNKGLFGTRRITLTH